MIEVYIDGASAGNPGLSGAGIFINNNGSVERYSIPLGKWKIMKPNTMHLLKH